MTKSLRRSYAAAGWLTSALLLAAAPTALAQTGGVRIGTAGPPDAKAVLDLSATDKGLLIPRLSQTQRLALGSNLPNGLMVFQTDNAAGFWYFFGGSWLNIPSDQSAQTLSLNGQTLSISGGNSVTLPSGGGSPSGAAGGDLAGTYPNPTVAAGAIGTTKLADNAVGLAKLSATGTPSATTFLRGDNTWATPDASSGWNLGGNSLTGSEFIGSTNNQDFIVQRNSGEAFRVKSNGAVTVGNNSPGSSSVMLGFNAGAGLTSAISNTFVGALAGETNNNNGNTFVGYAAGQKSTGSTNTMLGHFTGSRMVSGDNNVFIGNSAAYNRSLTPTGSGNVVIGASAGASLTTNQNNILLGGNSQASGGLYDAYALGNNAFVSQSNSMVIGNVRGTNDVVSVGIGISNPSSTLQVNGTFAVGVVNNYGGGSSGNANGIDQGSINTQFIGGYYGLAPTSTNSNYYRLPDPASCTGRVYYLRNNSSSVGAILVVNSGQLIDSASSSGSNQYGLSTTGSTKTVIAVSDGTNWTIMRTGGNNSTP